MFISYLFVSDDQKRREDMDRLEKERQAEMRSYKNLMVADKMTSNKDIASANKSLQEMEEDFMWMQNQMDLIVSIAVMFTEYWMRSCLRRMQRRKRKIGGWGIGVRWSFEMLCVLLKQLWSLLNMIKLIFVGLNLFVNKGGIGAIWVGVQGEAYL